MRKWRFQRLIRRMPRYRTPINRRTFQGLRLVQNRKPVQRRFRRIPQTISRANRVSFNATTRNRRRLGATQRQTSRRRNVRNNTNQPLPSKPEITGPFYIENYTCAIESELRQSPRPTIDFSGPRLEWPLQLTPIFAISLRKHRFNDLLVRMKQWSPLITLLPASDGHKISPDRWAGMGRLKVQLCSGQIGCYESHVRTWQKIVDQHLRSALILEDDADITYTQTTVDRLNQFLAESKTITNWDVAYIGNIGLHPIKQKLTDHITEPSNWEGLYTYYITNAGAQKLLKNAFPINSAIDIYVGAEARAGRIRTVSMTPSLNYVVPVDSDTSKNL